MFSFFQGLPGIIGPPGPAGQRGDKVGHMTKTHNGSYSQKHVHFKERINHILKPKHVFN